MTATNRPRVGRVLTIVLAAAAAVAATAFTGSAGQAAVIQSPPKTVQPLPDVLSGYRLAKQFTGADIAGTAWNAPANDPGGCAPNPAQVFLTKAGAASMQTSGQIGNCVEVESPHPYPTVAGYVYEASVYDSSFDDWGGFWSYGNNWPAGGELDAVETEDEQNYVSYHYAGNTTTTTGPWAHTLAPAARNLTTGWHIVDVAYLPGDKIEVFYDGHLYVTIAGDYITGAPAWIVFGDGSCQSATYSVCASATDIGVAGNFEVKWLRIFTK